KKNNFLSKGEYNEAELQTGHKNEHYEKILLKNIELIYFKENSVKIRKEKFTEIVAPYINTLVSFDEIKNLSQNLTAALKREGAMLVNVVVPPQDFYNGHVKFNVYQGRLDKIILDNNSRVQNNHIIKIAER
ncbi:POTRA domain-containing protein, partial [Escherichia coli]